jgi:hypothetical protein
LSQPSDSFAGVWEYESVLSAICAVAPAATVPAVL